MTAYGGYIAQGSYPNPVELDRNVLKNIFPGGGVVDVGMFDATKVVGQRQLSLAAGMVVIPGTGSAQGSYAYFNDAATVLSFSAPSANPRIDTVILEAVDAQYGTDPISGVTSGTFTWAIVSGTPAASPTAPSDSAINAARGRPGAWIRMYDVQVNTSATTDLTGSNSVVTRKFRYVAARGGIVAVYDATDLPGAFSSPMLGQQAYVNRYGYTAVYNGSAWKMNGPYVKDGVVSGTTITWSDLPPTLKKIQVSLRGRAAGAGTASYATVNFNGDATSGNYAARVKYIVDSSPAAVTDTTIANGIGYVPLASAGAGRFSQIDLKLIGCDNPSGGTATMNWSSEVYLPDTSTANSWYMNLKGVWVNQQAPITSIVITSPSGNWVTGTEAVLEGLD